MEYLEGRDPHQALQDDGPFSGRRASEIMIQVLGALAAAHDMGVVHRDIKPANIRTLEKQPARRCPSARELRRALKEYLAGSASFQHSQSGRIKPVAAPPRPADIGRGMAAPSAHGPAEERTRFSGPESADHI